MLWYLVQPTWIGFFIEVVVHAAQGHCKLFKPLNATKLKIQGHPLTYPPTSNPLNGLGDRFWVEYQSYEPNNLCAPFQHLRILLL